MISIDSQVAFETNRIESKCVCDILTLFAAAAAAAPCAPCVAVLRRAINKAKCSISLGAAYTEHCPFATTRCLPPLCVHCVLCWATVIRLDHSTKKLNLHINIIWVLAGLLCLLPACYLLPSGSTSLHCCRPFYQTKTTTNCLSNSSELNLLCFNASSAL